MSDTERRCGGCGMPSHRYGTGDYPRKYDATACVNMLRSEVEEKNAEIARLRLQLVVVCDLSLLMAQELKVHCDSIDHVDQCELFRSYRDVIRVTAPC